MSQSLFEVPAEDLRRRLTRAGQPGFRAGQVLKWVFQRDAAEFGQMTDLPAELRQRLSEEFSLEAPQIVARSQGPESLKLLLEMSDGAQVECVRIKMGRTYTACLSTQVGCSVGCVFCATGQTRCLRNLTAAEILVQLAVLRRLTRQERGAAAEGSAPPISNVVSMGMGEPLMNYEATVAAVRRMTDRDGYGMSASRIAISTAGVAPMIRRLAGEGLGVELAVSLNAPTDALRARLMPGMARWPLGEVLESCQEYSAALGGQPVTFAYVLVEGLNDDLEHAIELAKLLRRQPHHLNLIPLNPVSHAPLQPPSKNRIHAFVEMARSHGLNASLRRSKGADIDAACGQLRGRVQAAPVVEAPEPQMPEPEAPRPVRPPSKPPEARPARTQKPDRRPSDRPGQKPSDKPDRRPSDKPGQKSGRKPRPKHPKR